MSGQLSDVSRVMLLEIVAEACDSVWYCYWSLPLIYKQLLSNVSVSFNSIIHSR